MMFPLYPLMKYPHLIPLTLAAGLASGNLCAQRLQGHLEDPTTKGAQLVVSVAKGSSFIPVDSVRTDAAGDFSFPETFKAAGFYRLALNDTDRMELILDGREPVVDLDFDSIPLADHVLVRVSDENKRLWEFKYISKETQAVRTAAARQRMGLLPTDTAQLEQLDAVEQRAMHMEEQYVHQLVTNGHGSYFAKVLMVDDAVRSARGKGPMAVAAACDFSDPELMRSSVYDKAVMVFLQNLNVVSEDQFVTASDTLMRLAERDPGCRAYMLDHLIDLFSTYGPEMALQHMIDRYVVPLADSTGLAPALRAKVDALMHISVGRTAPDVGLNDHGVIVPLSELVKDNTYTALFFYSSTCEHCHAQMPMLKIDRTRFMAKGFQVIGIALDVDSVDFLKSIADNAIPWKCYSEFNGWGSKAAQAFLVKATPGFFLLDNRMRIVAKPTDADELSHILQDLYK